MTSLAIFGLALRGRSLAATRPDEHGRGGVSGNRTPSDAAQRSYPMPHRRQVACINDAYYNGLGGYLRPTSVCDGGNLPGGTP